jgi:hypothetical protein
VYWWFSLIDLSQIVTYQWWLKVKNKTCGSKLDYDSIVSIVHIVLNELMVSKSQKGFNLFTSTNTCFGSNLLTITSNAILFNK